MKRALRIDKIRLAAIEATLRLYRDPDRLAERLPTLRMMARPLADIEAAAARLKPAVAAAVGPGFAAGVIACASQIGSGSLPTEVIPSAGIALRVAGTHGKGRALTALAAALRALDRPVIGRIENDAFMLDLRCLEDEAAFVRNLATLRVEERR
jgi:L-seryl-tRNA(Ser) seleniumtransferase